MNSLANAPLEFVEEYMGIQDSNDATLLLHFAKKLENNEEKEDELPIIPPMSPSPAPLEVHIKQWLAENISIFNDPGFIPLLHSGEMYGLLYGFIQSGKSAAQLGVCMYNALIKKQSTILILRNSKSDLQQAVSNIKSRFGIDSTDNRGEWRNYCINSARVESTKYLTFLNNSNQNVKNTKAIMNALTNGTDNPCVIVALANDKQLKRLCKIIRNINQTVESNYFVVCDEVDTIGTSDKKKLPVRNGQYDILKRYAKGCIGVSATNFNLLFGDQNLSSKQIFRLAPKAIYKGVENLTFIPWLMGEPKFVSKQSMLTFDDELIPFMLDMSRKQPYTCKTITTNETFKHPVIVLNKSSNFVAHHQEFVRMFAGNVYTFPVKWLAISYDGEGVTMYHPLFQNAAFNIKRKYDGKIIKPSPCIDSNGLPILKFDSIQIGDVLEHFRKTDTHVQTFTHIAIASGLTAARGVNFVSNNYSAGVHPWHISDMYYRDSVSSDCTTNLQALRILGNYDDDLPLSVNTYQCTIDSIVRAHHLQEKLVQGMIQLEHAQCAPEFAEELGFSKDEVPNRLLTDKYACRLNVAEDPVDQIASDEEWGIPHMLNNIRRALQSGRETIVIKILKFLLGSCPDRRATREEIENVCDVTVFTDYTQWRRDHGRYELIIRYDNDWTINPAVLEALDKSNLLHYFE